MLSTRLRVDLGIIAANGDSILSRFPEQQSHSSIKFSAIAKRSLSKVGGLIHLFGI